MDRSMAPNLNEWHSGAITNGRLTCESVSHRIRLCCLAVRAAAEDDEPRCTPSGEAVPRTDIRASAQAAEHQGDVVALCRVERGSLDELRERVLGERSPCAVAAARLDGREDPAYVAA